MQRRLAAIMIADVIGYGRLSQIDEEGTRARFSADLTEIFEPKIAAYRGRLVKTMGDGLLVEFPSVVDALRCAVEAQQEMAKRNAAKPASQRLNFRIGVNLGDVIVEGDDIHGDGVNIADRIQALAEPGGVAISGAAYDHVKSKLPVAYASLGKQKLKNIAEPIRAYRIVLDAAAVPKAKTAPKFALAGLILLVLILGGLGWFWLWRPMTDGAATLSVVAKAGPSLVVLPFDNLSGDAEQGYLADGLTEDLTTELARTPDLFVISRNAASAYKDKRMTPTDIAKELGVRYLLEGSVRRAGDQLRINAQLIDATSGGHLWAERFDGNWNEVFAVEDQVIAKVASALKLQLITGPRMAKAPGGTTVPAAYELYLRWYGGLGVLADPEAVSLLTQAVTLDPDYGQAWAELAWIYWNALDDEALESALGVSNSEAVRKIKELLRQAEKHPSSSYHQLKADLLIWQQHWDEAIANAARAIALDPSDPYGYHEMAAALIYGGRAADAQTYLESAMRVDPRETAYRHLLGALISFSSGRFAEAIASLDKSTPQDLSNDSTRRQRLMLLTAAYAQLDQAEEAASARAELEKLAGEMTVFRALQDLPFRSRDDIERLRTGLSKAGLPYFPFGFRWESPERLSGDEIQKLVFGHHLSGQSPSGLYDRMTTEEGIARVSLGSEFSSTGVSRMESDFICTAFDEAQASCATIFRNPTGSAAKRNEFTWVTPWDRVEFSVVGDVPGSELPSAP